MLKRLMLVSTLTLLALLIGADGARSASARNREKDDNTQTIVRTREFTVPPGQCSQLPANLAVHGQGIEHTTIRFQGTSEPGDDDDENESDADEGGVRIRVSSTITGTATDNLGNKYRFFYRNRFSGPFPGTVMMTDVFTLTGRGPADGWSTFFRAKVTFDATFTPIGFELLQQAGDPFHCDPL